MAIIDGSNLRLFFTDKGEKGVHREELSNTPNKITISGISYYERPSNSNSILFPPTYKGKRRLNRKQCVEALAKAWGISFSLARKTLVSSKDNVTTFRMDMYELSKFGFTMSIGDVNLGTPTDIV